MEPTDLTVRLLQELRDGQRAQTAALGELQAEMREGRDAANQRFEVLETVLRDLAQQLVVLGRGVKVAIEVRAATEGRLEDHEQRLRALESAAH